jgi:NTE family protein
MAISGLFGLGRKPDMGEPADARAPPVETSRGEARLRASPLFAGVDASALAAIMLELDAFSLPAGWILFREGEAADALYVVTYGLLAVTIRGTDGGERLVAEIHGGETVGEMALISEEPRSATVAACRDTELLRLDRRAWSRIVERHPRAMMNVAAILAQRLNRTTHATGWSRGVKTLALLPAAADVPCAALARSLSATMSAAGRRTRLVEAAAASDTTEQEFSALEEESDLVVFHGECEASPWTKLCIRQADRILLVARAGQPPPPHLPIDEQPRPRQRIDLLLLHESDADAISPASLWLDRFPIDLVCRARLGRASDLERVVRLLTGRAVGLVLAGAGARGFAHLGVIRALRQSGVPVDLVGGTSMGAIIAAGVALEWDEREFRERLHRVFVESNPVSDYAVPLLALAKGRKVAGFLQQYFGGVAIEDLWRPYYCVSASLTAGRAVVHRRGSLARALQASTAIPGLLPPVVEKGEVLVDGGVVNNFPTDVMAASRRGPVIGVNVINDRVTALSRIGENPTLRQLLGSGGWREPPIVSILMRAGTMSSETQTELCRGLADLLLEPPLAEIDFLDWKALDRAAEIGYRHTMEKLEQGTFRFGGTEPEPSDAVGSPRLARLSAEW